MLLYFLSTLCFITSVSYGPLLIIVVCRTVRRRRFYTLFYTVRKKLCNILSRLSLPVLLVLCMDQLFFYMGWVDFLQVLLSKVGFSLGGRALTCALFKLGLPGRLAFWISFFILTGEGASGNLMMPNGEETSGSGEKLPLPAGDESPVPSISSQGDSWIAGYYGDQQGEAASSGAAQGGGASSLVSAAEAVVIPSPAISQGELLGESSNPQVGIPQEDGAEHLPVIPVGGEWQEEASQNEAEYLHLVRRITFLTYENTHMRSQIDLYQILQHLPKRD